MHPLYVERDYEEAQTDLVLHSLPCATRQVQPKMHYGITGYSTATKLVFNKFYIYLFYTVSWEVQKKEAVFQDRPKSSSREKQISVRRVVNNFTLYW